MLLCCNNRAKDSRYIALHAKENKLEPELALLATDIPIPNDNEILIQVKIASISSIDRHHFFKKNNISLTKDFIFGRDFSGIIKQVGKKVTKFKDDDRVYGYIKVANDGGTFAEFITLDQNNACLIPEGFSFESSAVIPYSAISAYILINKYLTILPGQRVLINNACREEGYYAVQFAKMKDAYVYGCVNSIAKENVDELIKIGAHEVGEYWLPSKCPNGLDYVIDFTYKSSGSSCFVQKIKKDTGFVVYIDNNHYPTLLSQFGVKGLEYEIEIEGDELDIIDKMIREKKLSIKVGEKYKFDQYETGLENYNDNILGKDILLVDKEYRTRDSIGDIVSILGIKYGSNRTPDVITNDIE